MRLAAKIAVVFTVFAMMNLFAAPDASAFGVAPNVCIHANGNLIVKSGTADCFSTPGSGLAVARGADSYASVNGVATSAYAYNGGTAIVFQTPFGFAYANGAGAVATTSGGKFQRAVTVGDGTAQLVNCEFESISSFGGAANFKAC